MRKKRLFTTILILMTFIVALFLALGTLTKNTIEISKDPYQEWEVPTYTLGPKENISWPTVDTDQLARAFIGYNGEFDSEKFEAIFIGEFESEFEYENCTYEFIYNDDNVSVLVDSKVRMIGDSMVKNPTHTYSYHLKTNA